MESPMASRPSKILAAPNAKETASAMVIIGANIQLRIAADATGSGPHHRRGGRGRILSAGLGRVLDTFGATGPESVTSRGHVTGGPGGIRTLNLGIMSPLL